LLALPLATLYLCLSLALTFNALFLLTAEISDPALALAQILIWDGWTQIAVVAVICSTLCLGFCRQLAISIERW